MHHVCESCGGTADNPGVCQTGNCEHKGKDMKECDCSSPENHKKEWNSSESEGGVDESKPEGDAPQN